MELTKSGSKTQLISKASSGSKNNLAASKGNLLGSRNNLGASEGNLTKSLSGSKNYLSSKSNLTWRLSKPVLSEPQAVVAPPPAAAANAIIYENTFKMKPDVKYEIYG
jgi:hypothetical protein